MSLSDLASIGNLLSGLAVLISLIYLALQIRQNTKATMSAAMASWLSDYNGMLQRGSSDAEMTRMFRAGLTEFNSMSGNDKTRFAAIMTSQVYNAAYIFHQRSERTFDKHIADSVLGFNAALLKSNGGQQWWQQMRGGFSPTFETHMNELAQAAKPVTETMPWFRSDDS